MKKIFAISVLVLLFSCKNAIKNEEELLTETTFNEIKFVEPKITNSKTVNSVNDLLGYWVGVFEADISEKELDSIYDKYEEEGNNIIFRKITFSIDEIKGDSIFGHSIVAGNINPFKGLISQFDNNFTIKADEFKKSKNDGVFEMNIKKTDTIIYGNWVAFNPTEIKISKRKYELQKKNFIYNNENKIANSYRNVDKSKAVVISDTIDGEIDEYEDTEFFSTTDKVFTKNASKDLLDKEFVSNLTKADIFILRNSIFARHGFAFRDKNLRIYFESFDWYMPVFGDVKEDLTELEKKNIDLLLRYEQNAIEYYDTFGR